MSDLSRLTPDEVEELAEFSGKLMSDGMSREAADKEALKRIQADREKKRVPRFEKNRGNDNSNDLLGDKTYVFPGRPLHDLRRQRTI
jgi:hypothetical protein